MVERFNVRIILDGLDDLEDRLRSARVKAAMPVDVLNSTQLTSLRRFCARTLLQFISEERPQSPTRPAGTCGVT